MIEGYVGIEQMQLDPLMKLVTAHAGAGRWARVRHFGERALEINPSDAELLLALGRAYLETGAADRALYTFDSALLVKPAMRRPALAHNGRARALFATGARPAARKALATALALEPDNPEALGSLSSP